MGRELRYNGGRDSIHILPVLVQSPINFLNKGTRIIQQILRGVDLADDLRNGFLRQLIYQVINRFVMRIKGCFVDLGAFGNFFHRDFFHWFFLDKLRKRAAYGTFCFLDAQIHKVPPLILLPTDG